MAKKRQFLTEVIEEAVDKGATTVEEIHKSVADLPLKLLEESEFLKKPAKEMRHLQDRTIGALYDLVRDINQRVAARLTRDLLREPTRRPSHAAGPKIQPAQPRPGTEAR